MRSPKGTFIAIVVGAALLGSAPARANRCGDQNPERCGLDTQTDPPTLPGGTGGCTEASMDRLPLYQGTRACPDGYTKVIYDLAQPFPDNGMPADQAPVGATSFVTLRAGASSPCAHMVDDVDPKPCPDPKLCPDPGSSQPEGARKVGLTGFIVGCWSPPDHEGCRTLAIYTKSLCLHAQHELLGPGCGKADDIDCSQVSTEQIGMAVPGAKNRRLCPSPNPAASCRGLHGSQPGLHFWIGGVCTTNNCSSPGQAPAVDGQTCKVSWGATKLGYNFPAGRGINEPGWYDWKTGAFKVDLSSPKPSCGALGRCLAERAAQPWDLRLVAVPRPGQNVPCVGDACDARGCFK
jgi:hypothetical protein